MRHELAHLAQAERDPVPVIARDDDHRRYYTPDATQNADAVIEAMSFQNPIAGSGDWNRVWTLLDELPTAMLLDTLHEIDARGRLHEMWGNVAGRPGRVRGAIAAALLLSEGGFYVFWSPWPGVILYQWGPGTFDPARFRVRGIGWQWIAIPLLALGLALVIAIAPESAPPRESPRARFTPVLAL